MPSFSKNYIINFVGFQLIWLIAVIGAAKQLLWPAIFAVLVFSIWQLAPARRHPNDLRFASYALIFGIVFDGLWQGLGLIKYELALPVIAPVWILLLWITLALTIHHSLAWLKTNPWFPVLFGMIGAPLSYLAGTRLQAISYPDGSILISVLLAISWAGVMFFFTQHEKIFSHSVRIKNE